MELSTFFPRTWPALATRGQLSHASPTPSPSWSLWSVFLVYGQLSLRIIAEEERKIILYYMLSFHHETSRAE
jgi:hypothetical protein